MIRKKQRHNSTMNRIGMVTVLAALCNPALAEYSWRADVTSINLEFAPAIVEVKSEDGADYNKTVAPVVDLEAHVEVQIDAGLFGKVKEWSTWLHTGMVPPGGGSLNDDWNPHYDSKLGMIYHLGGRPRTVDRTEHLLANFKYAAVSLCNDNADSLREMGWSDEQIFAQDHVVGVAVDALLQVTFISPTGIPMQQEVEQFFPDFEVHCKAYQVVISDDGPSRSVPARITSVMLDLDYDAEPEFCPTEVEATATFFADQAGDFAFRFETASGQVSKPIHLSMEPGDEQFGQYIKYFQDTFWVGAEPIPPRPVGGAIDQAVDDELTVFVEDEVVPDSRNPRFPQGPGTLTGVSGDPNQHKNSLWIEILDAEDGSVVRSDYAQYDIYCTPDGIVHDPDVHIGDGFSVGRDDGLDKPSSGVIATN